VRELVRRGCRVPEAAGGVCGAEDVHYEDCAGGGVDAQGVGCVGGLGWWVSWAVEVGRGTAVTPGEGEKGKQEEGKQRTRYSTPQTSYRCLSTSGTFPLQFFFTAGPSRWWTTKHSFGPPTPFDCVPMPRSANVRAILWYAEKSHSLSTPACCFVFSLYPQVAKVVKPGPSNGLSAVAPRLKRVAATESGECMPCRSLRPRVTEVRHRSRLETGGGAASWTSPARLGSELGERRSRGFGAGDLGRRIALVMFASKMARMRLSSFIVVGVGGLRVVDELSSADVAETRYME
jgi:hypothetical protein